jgi:hypothetical protein
MVGSLVGKTRTGPEGPVLYTYLAERRGFEPRLGLTLNTLSRRAT